MLEFKNIRADLLDGSGVFTWDDGVPRMFTVDGIQGGFIIFTGEFDLSSTGVGPTIGDLTATVFTIRVDLGTNPFTTTEDLVDPLPGSPVVKMFIGVSNTTGLTQFGTLDENVSGSVERVVSEPESLALILVGLAGAGYAGRRRFH